ncbi:MAG: Lsm family RNA-binding protein [Nitrososphaeria archaeon]
MPIKIRDFGDFPYYDGTYKEDGDKYYCEICRDSGKIGEDLLQCPECGRWVCSSCWNSDEGICKVCSKDQPRFPEPEKFIQRIKQLEIKLAEIETYVKNLDVKLERIKFCPFCNAPMPKKARYCGICGKEVVSEGATQITILPPKKLFDLKALADRLEDVFPTMVELYESQGFILVMGKIKVTEKGVIAGSGPAAERVKKVYEQFIKEKEMVG